MPITQVNEGNVVKIENILCGYKLKKRLNDLGFYKGTKVIVSKNDVHGPIVVKILDSHIVLGRGEALKIMVEQ